MLRRIQRAAARLRWRSTIYSMSVAGRLRRRPVVHMLHLSKTGGTAVKDAIGDCLCGSGASISVHNHRTKLADIPPWDDVFFFLRDPISRYVSGFNSRLREGRPRYRVPWTPAERRAFERFRTPDELATALSSDDIKLRKQARQAMRSIGNVGWHYANWLRSPSFVQKRRRQILFVGRQETLTQDFERLKMKLGLPAHCTLPADETAAHRAPGGQPTQLSETARANLRDWYRVDYELLECCASLET